MLTARRARARTAAALAVVAVALGAGCASGDGGTGPGSGGASGRAEPRGTTTARRMSPPERPLPVGEVTLTVTDRSRSIPARDADPGAPARVLPVLVLYPASAHGSASPRRNGAPYPLVVFSHGFTGAGPAYAPFLRRIAAHGYVVAAPTFPRTSSGAPGGPRLADYVHQPTDVRVVIDALAGAARRSGDPRDDPRITLTGEAGALAGLVDTDRVAVAGHSLGGATTLGVAFHTCCRDRRVRAAIPIAPVQLPFPDGTYAGTSLPVLLIHGDRDPILRHGISVDLYATARPPKAFLSLLGAGHTPFVPPWQDPIVTAMQAFLDRYLRMARGTLGRLEAAARPGVATLQTAGVRDP